MKQINTVTTYKYYKYIHSSLVIRIKTNCKSIESGRRCVKDLRMMSSLRTSLARLTNALSRFSSWNCSVWEARGVKLKPLKQLFFGYSSPLLPLFIISCCNKYIFELFMVRKERRSSFKGKKRNLRSKYFLVRGISSKLWDYYDFCFIFYA